MEDGEMPQYTWQFEVAWQHRTAIMRGVVITWELTLLALAIASILGLALAIMSMTRVPAIRLPAIWIIEFFRGLPALVVLIWIYYSLPILTGINFGGFVSSVVGLALCQSAYSAEIFRAGIEAIDKGQMESARSLGMSYVLAMRRIILPQAVRIMVPPFINTFANMLKWTSLASVVAVAEILHRAENIIQLTFRPMEIYTAIALVYFVMIFPFTWLSRGVERRLTYA
jgi:polar amino acid transport system permease protein